MQYASPFQFPLGFVAWDIFGTLTFKGSVPVPRKQWGAVWQFLRRCSGEASLSYGKALIAVRREQGEQRGRVHFHYLLGGLRGRPRFNLRAFCFRSRYWWKLQTGGMSVVVPYDDALPGVAYVLKGLSMSSARAYELGKFGMVAKHGDRNTELELSDSVKAYLRCHLSVMAAAAGSQTEKLGGVTGNPVPALIPAHC